MEKKNLRYRDSIRTHVQTHRQKVTNQMSYQEKKGKKNNNRKEKKKKHLTVVDPETLFMRNSKLIYCPKTCIAQYQKFSNGRTCV